MTIWIIEYNNLSINSISVWLKANVNVKKYIDKNEIDFQDIVIASQKDPRIVSTNFTAYTLVYYEDLLENLSNDIISEFTYNYDFYYLKNAIAHAISPESNIDTIITGSSYGLFGIDASLLKSQENLSLPSQDLYYSLKGIYNVCSQNHNIKNIILCCGYYYFFSDLSKVKNDTELQRIS